MIKIVYEKRNKLHDLTVIGHAGYAEHGKDIVCSAVSTLISTLALNIQEINADNLIKLEPGESFIQVNGHCMKADHAFKVIVKGLEALAEQYPNNVSLEYK